MSDPGAEHSERPAICLNMIVRNEAHIVAEALDSVAPYIGSWVIVDTGSDDGTQDLIRDHMARLGIPGELYERPWRNFGDNRTEALALAQGHGDYVWVVDADDLLVGTPDFAGLGADVYWVRYLCNAHGYYRSQLFRDGVRVRWVGVTHEAPMWDFDHCVEARLEGQYHVEDRQRGARNLSGQKYGRDRDLLLAEVERNPADARSVFYLAQSYYDLGDFANARTWYARRAEMGGWEEETYYALWRVAVSMGELNEPWPDVRDAYLRAWEFRPTRAEPLFAIAARYRTDGCYQLGYEFAKRAAEIPFPDQDMLFVRADIYNWRIADEQAVCASWIGKHAEAFTLWRRVLARSDIPENERQRLAQNRDICAPTMIEAASAYPDPPLLASLPRPGQPHAGAVVSLIAGPDLAATERTLNSFLRCCTDVSRVGRFLVIDAGLSGPDRQTLCQRYEFLEVVRNGAQLGQIRAQIDARLWLHLGQGWRFFAPENLITRLTAVLEAEPLVYQVGINLADAVKLTSASAPEQAVRRTPEAGRYLLTKETAHGPAMFDTARLDRAGVIDSIAELGQRARAAGMRSASLDEVLCIAGDGSEATLYTPAFYDGQAAGSSASAMVMVPMLAALTRPSSVLDVGCGVGGWVATWLDNGVDAIGVDGDYVPRAQLCIPADRFIDHNLTTPLDLGRRFDLVTCLEVAEHLRPEAAETLVDSLCRHGDVIVFSAAVPGQGGTGHINERWPSFWAALFATHGYRPYDLLRGRLWWDTRCEWWYRQNVLVYATDEVAQEHGWPAMTGPLDMVHPELFALRSGC
ncbi:glycosyltransferase [Mycobacterium persicum]|uniref:glycosyltransferase n=1 Tax=Mycobacterium persicum TaxID=1487726 RepID=UPI0013C32DAA|nr:glycosyltransferase [Mycobacterium persicum]